MICNRIQTIKLTEEEVKILAKAAIILCDLEGEVRDYNTIEINNSEWDYDHVDNAACLLDDLCKQGTNLMEVR